MTRVALGLWLCACVVWGAPSPSPARTTYDQRQHGELNIHAQLDNVVVVLIPASSASINLLELADIKGTKGGFLQQLLHGHKNDIDRYQTVKDDQLEPQEDNDIKTDISMPAIVSQQVSFNHEIKDEEKEEEVVATVEEMKPETAEKTPDAPSTESIENNSLKKQSTVGETVQESVLTVSMPESSKDEVEAAKEDPKESVPTQLPEKEGQPENTPKPEESSEPIKTSEEKILEKHESSEEDNSSEESKESSPNDNPIVPQESSATGPTLKDLIKPVASKDSLTSTSTVFKKDEDVTPKKTSSTNVKPTEEKRLVEGVRKEKVIKYKPESKWAPGLVELLGPAPARPRELEERQRFSGLCAPGAWDPELKTCIMPGENRSRKELARFLDAMRFGIAIPAQ